MFVYLDTSKMYCLTYRPDLYNLQIRKNSDKVKTVELEFSINSNTTRCQI